MNDDYKDALERYEAYNEADRHNIDEAIDDLRHIAGEQWPEEARRIREERGQPVMTVNKHGQFINQVAGDLMQQQPALDIVGVDDDQDPVLAEIMDGLIRQIETQSNASSVYNWAAKCAISCGIGHWQVITEYADQTTFDQDIRIKRIMNPLAVTWDSSAVELDRSDAKECFVSETISLDAFKKDFKAAKAPSPFPEFSQSRRGSIRWFEDDTNKVRIASHWKLVPVEKTIGLTQDGKVIDLASIDQSQWPSLGLVKVRKVMSHKVVHRRMSGDGYLEDAKDWAGKYIPIIPVIGNETSLDGQIIRSGVIRYAKDSQTLYNYMISSMAESVALQPKAPYILPLKSIEGLENYWTKANTDNLPYLPYHIDPDAPGVAPRREMPPQTSPGLSEQVAIAENNMYSTTGIYPTSLGQKSNESSGKAILAREKQSDTGTFVYTDNFKTSAKRGGEILVDLAVATYDSTRVVRVLGKDGQEAMAKLNLIVNDPFKGPMLINDLSAAKFDVRLRVGNSYASAKEKAHDAMAGLLQSAPDQYMPVFGDLFFETFDFPGSQKIAERIKKTMPAALVGEGGMQPQQNPMEEVQQRLALEGMTLDNQKKAAETQGKQIDNMSKSHQFGISVATADQPEETAQSRAA